MEGKVTHDPATGTMTFTPRQVRPGICAEHDLAHAWEDGPILTSYPPIATRRCKNCGQEQRLQPSDWQNYP